MGWRWIFGVVGLIALAVLLAVVIALPETSKPDATMSLRGKKVWKDYVQVFRNPVFIIYGLVGSISYAGMFAYIAGSPTVFMQGFGFSDLEYGWAFALNAAGLIIGSQINRLALKRFDALTVSKWSGIFLLITGALLLLTALLGMAGAALTLCFTFFYLFFLGFLNPNTQALALEPFSHAAGRSSALLGSMQMLAGVIASACVSTLIPRVFPACLLSCLFAHCFLWVYW